SKPKKLSTGFVTVGFFLLCTVLLLFLVLLLDFSSTPSFAFVVGGAVQGGRIYGDIPPADFNHDLDAGSGRLIPTLSVEQFAEPLGRWFGLNDSEIANALPNLANFGGSQLDFV
ncbi:MAG: hypothetical protein VXW22_10950, partial [Pseudomonadota bacterium]|nr:hypothetical protein [Pseudomonadota bacterium]